MKDITIQIEDDVHLIDKEDLNSLAHLSGYIYAEMGKEEGKEYLRKIYAQNKTDNKGSKKRIVKRKRRVNR